MPKPPPTPVSHDVLTSFDLGDMITLLNLHAGLGMELLGSVQAFRWGSRTFYLATLRSVAL